MSSESGRNDVDEPSVSSEPNSDQEPKSNPAILNKAKLKLRNVQYNRRKWRKLKATAKKWIDHQGSTVAPFVIMRLKKGVLEWGGPSFMRGFAENQEVIGKFKEAVFLRPVSFGNKGAKHETKRTGDTDVNVDQVKTADLKSLPVSSLRRLLTEICNLKGVCGFWQNPDNKPPWWSSDTPFQSPNWVSGGGSKLQRHQLICLLEANYKSADVTNRKQCPDPSDHQDHEPTKIPSRSPTPPRPSVTDRILQQLKKKDYRSCLTTLQDLPWEGLQEVCSNMIPHVTAMKPSLDTNKSLADFPAQKVDGRRSKLARLPTHFAALHSTGDGDCLFHSLSTLVNGTEEATLFIRLASTVYGVCHASHYVSMYLEECSGIQAACAFMHMMCTHPPPGTIIADWTMEEIICYTVRDQAASTAKINSYSGILQVLFAAGYLGVYIQQHSEDYAPGYDTLINPCACEEQDNLPAFHVMWVKASPSGAMNHFVPLVPRRAQSRRAAHKGKKFNLQDVAENFCIACLGEMNMCQADVNHLDTWIECDKCHRWYHCLCTGVAHTAAANITFVCCSLDCLTSVAKLNGTTVTVADINRIRNGEDLSGDSIDFFMSHLMSNTKTDAYTLPFYIGQILHPNSWLHTLPDVQAVCRMQEHLRAVGITATSLLQYSNILIPVCTNNHWVGILVQQKDNTLLILDSLPGFLGVDIYQRLHKFVCRYLNLVAYCVTGTTPIEEPQLRMESPKVVRQDNIHDCGVFLLSNFEAFLNGAAVDDFNNISTDAIHLRRQLMSLIHEYSQS